MVRWEGAQMSKSNLAGVAVGSLIALWAGACARPQAAPPATDTGKIADTVKSDVAQAAADFNAHDAVKLSSHDAPDVVGMVHGAPNVVGAADALANNRRNFAMDPSQHVTITSENVDVAGSGEMAIYRSTYVLSAVDPKSKKTVSENGNYLAEYKRQSDGSWKIAWSVISDTAPPPPKS
jgi:ketosteroid isomerase-like protein